MKKDIHPKIYTDTKVTCACGNSFVTTSTKQSISVDICSACHPFYTGQQKFVDTEGRIEKFEKKLKISQAKQEKKKAVEEKRKQKRKEKEVASTTKQPTLKELLKKAKG